LLSSVTGEAALSQSAAIPLEDRLRAGIKTSHWTPEVLETAVWPSEQIEIVETAARDVFNEICGHFDPLWPVFGWAKTAWSKPVIKQVA
jgi:hypothetical protein